MSRKRLTTVLIGAGSNMRHAHVRRIEEDGSVEVVGIADPSEEAAQECVDEIGQNVAYFSDWKEMVKAVKSDLAIISTPHNLHYSQAKACLTDGRHTLVEKPLVLTTVHANGLLNLAKKRNLILSVAYQRHVTREYVHARNLIQAGKLGTIQGVAGHITQNWTDFGGWRTDAEACGGGMFVDTGSHLVAALLWLTGLKASKVSVFHDQGKRQFEANLGLNMRFSNGAVGTLAFLGSSKMHDELLLITGEQGLLKIEQKNWRLSSFTLNGKPISIPARTKSMSPDASFFAAVRSKGRNFEYPQYAVEVARLTTAGYKSKIS